MNAKLNISGLLSKQATKVMMLTSFAKENSILIILVLILRFITISISVFSGYSYFLNILKNLVELPEIYIISISVVFVLTIEILAAIFLIKLFKFALKLQWLSALGYGLGVLLFFVLSFYISVNGLASFTTKKLDNSETITSKYLYQKNIEYDNFNNLEIQIKQAIQTIENNPTQWLNGRLSGLSAKQQSDINNYYSQLTNARNTLQNNLKSIETSKEKELNTNTGNLKSEYEKYYKIAAVIMFISFLVNGLIAFFYHKIYNESEKEQVIKDTINSFSTDIANDTNQIIQFQISNQYQMYLSALNHALISQNALSITGNEKMITSGSQTENNETQTTTVTENNETENIPLSEPEPQQSEPEIKPQHHKKEQKPIGFVYRFNENRINENRIYDTLKPDDLGKKNDVKTTLKNDNETKKRICLNCNNEYIYNHKKQMYCSDKCRIEAWQSKTGGKVKKGKTKKH